MSLRGLLKKLGISLVTIFVSMSLTFFMLRLTPGNAFDKWAQDLAKKQGVSYEEARALVTSMSNYDPNEKLLHQFTRYVNGLIHGNFGASMYNETLTVQSILEKALPWTIFILTISLLISFIVGVNLGIIMAWKRKSILNPIISFYAIISNAIPNFLVAIALIIIFSFKLKWFPMRGAYDSSRAAPGFNIKFILDVLHHAILPIATYVLTTLGGWALTMKGSAVSVLGEDYITAAWVRGVPENRIMKYYIKKNAMLPLVTSLAISFGYMMGGSALIENQFNYPGLGFYMAQAAGKRDYTIMQGLLLITSVTVIIANFIADIIYAKLDPRVKLED
ncbi:ABC transporter permease [Clostridium sp. YIM B02515]|uniref:ABC transporter permease n=1 Tax=Clostridium rhizosphaerae TaxID=2803861 RepID=A0ABS1T956_9CLOT|nr:ABC transporter permease [Clostridium rhizosphaerae]MBL4935879.1 ABC transporter permease [Clostridium rhizosphaerae]